MRAIWNERMQLVLRIFLYIILVIFLVRNTMDIYYQFTGSAEESQIQNVEVEEPVPLGAGSAAKAFLEKWYAYQPQQKEEERLLGFRPLVTPELYHYIRNSNVLDYSPPKQPNNQAEQATQPQAPAPGTQQVDVWETQWVNKKTGEAKITARMVTEDQRILFLTLPVIKSGTTWFVSSLPSLVSAPNLPADKKIETFNLGDEKEKAIREVLNSFFAAWLAGNQEATQRYVEKAIPTSNILATVEGEFIGVLDLEALSEEPLRLKVTISIKDKTEAEILFHYFVTVQEKNGEWFIQSIQ